jgi:hypothetical protein
MITNCYYSTYNRTVVIVRIKFVYTNALRSVAYRSKWTAITQQLIYLAGFNFTRKENI